MHKNDDRYSSITIASLRIALIGGKCRKTRTSAKSRYLHENVPGAASAQGRKSNFWHNTPNGWLGEVSKFHGASANFLVQIRKTTGGGANRPLQ